MSRELTERNAQLRNELAERKSAEQALLKEKAEQAALIKKLEEAHTQLLQSEKLASIGQLAAGVAHEINNPIGFVNSNCGTLRAYVLGMLELIGVFEAEETVLAEEARQRINAVKERIELKYLREDVLDLLRETADGVHRVRKIVQDLKDFSHPDDGQWQQADLHHCLDSSINIVHNEVKYVADVVKDYGVIPEVECLPFQLNQVFLNLLMNASQATKSSRRGTITISTGVEHDEYVFVEVADDGTGVEPEDLKRIFDPFFTTKPIGKGTGLGLSVSYGIISKHNGEIDVQSQPGCGTKFRILLPIIRKDSVQTNNP
jgi:signal transduction histidine kinase